MNFIYFVVILILLIYIFFIVNNNLLHINTNYGTVIIYNDNNNTNIEKKIQLLTKIIFNMYTLKNHLIKNIKSLDDYKEYIIRLNENFTPSHTKIYETDPNLDITSYSINKGQEISMCLRSKISNEFHDINILTYVAIHEMAHIANPEIGHGPLFNKIFKLFIDESIKIGIYKYDDYAKVKKEFCGVIINSN